jgi:RNA polymerase sigma-70 factor (ECF subfamily)
MEELAAASYRRHHVDVYRFVRRRSGSADVAQDVTQEVFEAALAALAAERLTGEPPLAWLYTVAERRVVAAWRRTKEARGDLPPVAAASSADGELTYGSGTAEILLEALQGLPKAQRQVVVMKLFEERSLKEIAVRLGIQEGACRMRLSRGLAALRSRLESEGIKP